ncbi:MAG: lysophospholipid acyltransferase family protein [Bacteroidota bacterium]
MKLFLKPLNFLYWLYAVILFIVIMLLIFPFVIVASFFGRIRGGNMIYRLCMLWADIWFPLVFIWVKRIVEAKYDKSKPYIFVSNHVSYLDAAIIVKAFRQPLRPLGKVEISKVPIFGFIYRKAIVTVDRSSAENRAKSVSILKSIISKGISVLVFPEGTFNTSSEPLKEFYDGAFRVAIETQTPVKPVLFLDAAERLHHKSIFSLSPGRCRIVYLNEIPVDGMTAEDLPSLKEKIYKIMKEKLIEYNVSWITRDNLNVN